MKYKVFYRGVDANYPAFDSEEKALDFYLQRVQDETGETREEIMAEEWTSFSGVEKCVKVQEVETKGEKVWEDK